MAVCVDSGEELFRFGSRDDDNFTFQDTGFTKRFDFSPPSGKRHPGDKSVDVLALVKAGIMSETDVKNGRAFSEAELRGFMLQLEEFMAVDF